MIDLDRMDEINELVETLLEDCAIEEPPVDAAAIARRLGLEVCQADDQPSRGRLVHGRFQSTICVRPEPRLERQQWSIAHEIGEHLIARLMTEEPHTQSRAADRETLANEFAHRLLVPSQWLDLDCRSTGFDLLELKRRYRTASYEVLALRMLELETPTIVTVFDHGLVTRRKGNLPYRTPDLHPLEVRVQREAHETGRVASAGGEGTVVSAWPIHEEGWKREILRTVIELF